MSTSAPALDNGGSPPTDPDSNSKTPVEAGQHLVDALYTFRDRYYDSREVSPENALKKHTDVKQKMEETLTKLDLLAFAGKDKAYYYMLKGKVLNVTSEYSSDCQDCLSRALKLNPKLAEAWCQLGESHWKRGDVAAAHSHFRSALEHQTDKRVLRNLSMVLRQLSTTSTSSTLSNDQRASNIKESVERARAAVQLDVSDGRSWLNLANAYLTVFFSNPLSNSPVMPKCLSAFAQAERDPVAKSDPDLHYNWGIALHYQDEFSQALNAWRLASRLDPVWPNPQQRIEETVAFLRQLGDLQRNRGKLKEKRFRTLVESLAGPVKDRDLGPYAGGKFTRPGGGATVELVLTPLAELKPENNVGRMVLGRVICGVPSDFQLAYTFLIVDAQKTIIPIRVFNIGQGMGPSDGDSIVIPDPYAEDIIVPTTNLVLSPTDQTPEQPLSCRIIRVPTPDVLVVNGRRVSQKWTALPVMQNVYFSE